MSLLYGRGNHVESSISNVIHTKTRAARKQPNEVSVRTHILEPRVGRRRVLRLVLKALLEGVEEAHLHGRRTLAVGGRWGGEKEGLHRQAQQGEGEGHGAHRGMDLCVMGWRRAMWLRIGLMIGYGDREQRVH